MSYTKKGAEYVKRKYEIRGGGDYLAAERQSQPHCEKEKTCYTSDMKHHFESMKKGFTLAEVLITLGVIGIVAALTIPGLLGRYNEKTTVSRLKKAHSILSQAFMLAVEKYGPIENWNLGSTGLADPNGADTLLNNFSEFMNKTKACKVSETGCLPRVAYKALNGDDYVDIDGNKKYSRLKLSDGTIIAFYVFNPNCSSSWGGNKALENICAYIGVDINGNVRPNQFGIDYFAFLLTKYGIVPMGSSEQTGVFTFKDYCRDKTIGVVPGWGGNGFGCTAWVIYNENMDYLRCDDLSWDGKHTCKD